MTTRGQTIKLVVFLAVSAVLALGLLMAFGGLNPLDRPARYFVDVPGGVAGLERGSAVTLRGVRVGAVGEFELYPEGFRGVRVELEIDPDVRIARGASASQNFQGLTGLKTMNIEPGERLDGWLESGATIPYEPSGLEHIRDDAEELAARSVRVLEKVESLAERLEIAAQAVDPERVRRIVENVDHGIAEARQAVVAARHAGQEFGALARQARVELGQTAEGTRQLVAATRASVDQAGQAFVSVEQVSRDLTGLVRTSAADLRGITYDLREASSSLKRLGMELRQQPSRLLFSSPPPERELP